MNKNEVLTELDWMIKAAWGELKFEGCSVKHDPALARDLESIRDWVLYADFSDQSRFYDWLEKCGYIYNSEIDMYEKNNVGRSLENLLKEYRILFDPVGSY